MYILCSILNTLFPLAKHGSVLLLIMINLFLIFKFSKLSGSLFVHLLLQILSLNPIFFVHLLQNIHLMILSGRSFSSSSCFKFSILLSNSRFNLFSLIFFKPVHFSLLCLFQKDILLSRLIYIL